MSENYLSQNIVPKTDQLDLFGTILNTMDQSIIGIDGNGTIICFNHGSENLFGYKREEVLEKK